MPQYTWRGRSAGGDAAEGLLEAADAGAVAAHLTAAGMTPLRIEPASGRAGPAAGRPAAPLARGRIRTEEIMLFSRQMQALLKAGVPILRALAGLHDSSANPAARRAIESVREGLDSGRSLSGSMQRQPAMFSPFYVAMIHVGESTGRLEEVFLRLFHHLEFQELMRQQVRSAVRYPAFVVLTMAIAIAVINLFVIPAFAKVYRGLGADLPLMTRILVATSDFTVAAWPYLLGGALLAGFGWHRYVRTPSGRLWWDRVKLRMPVAGGILSKATIARFARGFALAFRSGVPVTQTLTLTAQTVDNAHMAARLEKMREAVERGESVLRAAVGAGIFTPVALQMIAVGEESGSLDDMMEEVAQLYQREVEYELKTLSQQIEPILIVGLGVLVLILALGVFLPIWDLGQAAFRKSA